MTALTRLLRSTVFRLSLIYLLVFAAFAAFLLAYINWNTRAIFSSQLVDTIEAEVQGLAEQYRIGGVPRLAQVISQRTRSPTNTLYLVTTHGGDVLAGNVSEVPGEALREQGLFRLTYRPFGGTDTRTHQALVQVFHLAGGYRLLVGRDIEETGRLEGIVRRASLWAAGLMLVLGVGGAIYVSRRILGRIDAISDTARTIMAGDLSERVARSGSEDEFDRLAESLNAMLDRIEQLMRGLKEVSDNIAHDLKTPLTRLRSRVEAVLREEPGVAAYHDALERTLEESDALIATFNALLMIARVEAGASGVVLEPVELTTVARDVAELYEPLAEEKGTAFAVEAEGQVMVRGNRELIGQAIANLLDNALKYGIAEEPEPAPIVIAVRRDNGAGMLVVADRGPGVPADARERVIERFGRLEESRSQPGFGLGLSLVSAVATLHGGALQLEDNAPGLRAVLTLPLAEPS